jgi:hypothetical protein
MDNRSFAVFDPFALIAGTGAFGAFLVLEYYKVTLIS